MQTEQVISNAVIAASITPLKRYSLRCPLCNEEEIYLPAGDPDVPFCKNCEEEIDVDSLIDLISGWMEYLKDRQALLKQERTKGEEDAG